MRLPQPCRGIADNRHFTIAAAMFGLFELTSSVLDGG
jgi:hypothetical protein